MMTKKFDTIKAIDEIVKTGRKLSVYFDEHDNWRVDVADPDIYGASSVSLDKAVEAVYRLVFR
jgi:hypothetical protein